MGNIKTGGLPISGIGGDSRVDENSEASSHRRSQGYQRVAQEDEADDANDPQDQQEADAASPQAGHREPAAASPVAGQSDPPEATPQPGRQEPGAATGAADGEEELNVLRGWRLLVASLSPEEWRDILSTSGRLDYESSDALQTLWEAADGHQVSLIEPGTSSSCRS